MKKLKLVLSLFLVIVCVAFPATVCSVAEELDEQNDKKAFSTVDYIVGGTGVVLTVGVIVYCLNKYMSAATRVKETAVLVKEEIAEIKKPLVEVYNKIEEYYNAVDKDKLKENGRVVLDKACDIGKKAVGYSNIIFGDSVNIADNLYEGRPTTQGTLIVGETIEKNKPFFIAVNSLSKKYVEHGKPYFEKYMQWLSQNTTESYSCLRTGYYDFID